MLVRFTEVYWENDSSRSEQTDEIAIDANDVQYVSQIDDEHSRLEFYDESNLAETDVIGHIDQVLLKLNQNRTRR